MSAIPESVLREAREIIDVLDAASDRDVENVEAERIKARYRELKRRNDFTTSSQIARGEYIARALTAAQQRIEELTRALGDVRPYLTDALDAHEHSDGRELLGRIDALLASKQGGEG